MRDQVVMSPMNGQLAIAVPLYRLDYEHELEANPGYSICVHGGKPVAYAIDCGDAGIHLMNADFVEHNLEFLGEL